MSSSASKRKKESAAQREDRELSNVMRISGALPLEDDGDPYASLWRLPNEADDEEQQPGREAMREQMRDRGLFDKLGVSPFAHDRARHNIVMNIKVAYFEDPNEPRFGRWQLLDERSKALYDCFSALVYLVSNPQFCLSPLQYPNIDAHLKKNKPLFEYSGAPLHTGDVPNVVFHCERVYTSARPREFVIARLWFHVLSPHFSFSRGIQTLIKEIDQERRKEKPGARFPSSFGGGGAGGGGRRQRDGWRSLVHTSRWFSICDAYRYSMQIADRAGRYDAAQAVELSDNNPYSPYRVFSIENAMLVDIGDEVREAQRTLINYKIQNDQQFVAFPHSNVVFSIPPTFVTLEMLMPLPLPGNHADTYAGRMAREDARGFDPMMGNDGNSLDGADERPVADPTTIARLEGMLRAMDISSKKDGARTDSGNNTEVEAQLLETCPEFRTQKGNLAAMEAALHGLEPGSPDYISKRAAEQKKAMARAESLLQSDDVASGPWREARAFMTSVLKRRTNLAFEANKAYVDSTVLQNMLISMMNTIEMEMSIHVNHFSFLMLIPVAYDCWDLARRLHYNLILAGKGSAGKSLLMEILAEWHVPGTVKPATHRTAQAYNTTETHIDGCKVYGEAPHDDMCIDPDLTISQISLVFRY